MTDRTASGNIFQLDPTPSHAQIWGETGHGKSVLVIQELLDDLPKTPSHLKINFRPNPSH